MGSPYTFKKSERLTSRRIIDDIFRRKGHNIVSGPLMLVYLKSDLDTTFPAQILLSVSKKKFNKAHHRNRIKRLLREAYRLQKHKIYAHLEGGPNKYALALLYLDKQEPSLEPLSEHLNQLINEFVKRTS